MAETGIAERGSLASKVVPIGVGVVLVIGSALLDASFNDTGTENDVLLRIIGGALLVLGVLGVGWAWRNGQFEGYRTPALFGMALFTAGALGTMVFSNLLEDRAGSWIPTIVMVVGAIIWAGDEVKKKKELEGSASS